MGSWVDVLLVLMLVTCISLGFHHGLLRQGLLLLAVYIGTVLSAQYYTQVADLLIQVFPTSAIDMANMVAFLALLFTITFLIAQIVSAGFRETRLPELVMVDNVGGATLGGVFGLFAISLSLMLASYVLQVPWLEGNSFKHTLSAGLSSSELSALFSAPVPVLQSALRPWIPGNVPFFVS